MYVKTIAFTFILSVSAQASVVRPGDRVIDASNDVGYVQSISTESGWAQVLFDNANPRGALSVRAISYLWRAIPCYLEFCANARFTDRIGYRGSIEEIFENGRAYVIYDNASPPGTRSLRSIGDFARPEEPPTCYGRICANARVINSRNEIGSVVAVDSFGSATVLFDDANPSGQTSRVPALTLSLKVPAAFGFYEGEVVIDGPGSYESTGTITSIFENGVIAVLFDDANPRGALSYRTPRSIRAR